MYGDWRSDTVTVGCMACASIGLSDEGYRLLRAVMARIRRMSAIEEPLLHALSWRVADDLFRFAGEEFPAKRLEVWVHACEPDSGDLEARVLKDRFCEEESIMVRFSDRWLESRLAEYERMRDPLELDSWGSLRLRIGPGREGISIEGPDASIRLEYNGYWLPYWMGRNGTPNGLVCRGQPAAIALARAIYKGSVCLDDIWLSCAKVYDREFERELESVAVIEWCGSMREAMEQMRNAMAMVLLVRQEG